MYCDSSLGCAEIDRLIPYLHGEMATYQGISTPLEVADGGPENNVLYAAKHDDQPDQPLSWRASMYMTTTLRQLAVDVEASVESDLAEMKLNCKGGGAGGKEIKRCIYHWLLEEAEAVPPPRKPLHAAFEPQSAPRPMSPQRQFTTGLPTLGQCTAARQRCP